MKDETALVTGGSRGIGRGIAEALGAAGCRVIVASRRREDSAVVAESIVEGGGRADAMELDVASDESVETVGKAIVAEYGRISFLVNNAGVARDQLLLRLKKQDWDAVLDTNLTSVYRTCRALVPSMIRARFGRIVNVTSVVAASGNPGQTNYAASKAGVEGFTRSLAREVATRNVTVNCIAPGFIDTDMTRELSEEARQKLLADVPMGRLGEAADVAAAVLFLCSPGAAYITGQTLNVNGGMYM